ncbi:cyclin-H, partial [Thraustotheca clavata]
MKKAPPKHVIDGTRVLLDKVRAKRVNLSRKEFIDLIANAGRCFSSNEAKVALELMKESMAPCTESNHRLLRALMRESKHDEAIKFFRSLDQLDVELFTEAIRSCGYNGDLDTARELLASMQRSGLKPTAKTYYGLIQACRKTIDIDAAQDYWREMINVGIVPNRELLKALMLVYRDDAVAERQKHQCNPPPFTLDLINAIADGLKLAPSTDTIEEFPIEILVDQAVSNYDISITGDMARIVLDTIPLVHYERWLKKMQNYKVAQDQTIYTYALQKLLTDGHETFFWRALCQINAMRDYILPPSLAAEVKNNELMRRRRQSSLLNYDIHRDRWTTRIAEVWLHSIRRSRIDNATVLAHTFFIVNSMVTSGIPNVDAKVLNALMASLYHGAHNKDDGPYSAALSLFNSMEKKTMIDKQSVYHALICSRHLNLANHAVELINSTKRPTLAMYNIAIDTCILSDEVSKAVNLFQSMPMRPNAFTFSRLFKGFSKTNDTKSALELLETMEDVHIGSADPAGLAAFISTFYYEPEEILPLLKRIRNSPNYITIYDEALHIFQVHGMWREATELLQLYNTFNIPKTTRTHVKFILTCANGDNYNLAMDYLYSLDEASTEVINAAILACVHAKKSNEALELFKNMQLYGLKPDATTFVRLFHALARNRDIDVLELLLQQVPQNYVTTQLYNRMLGACVLNADADKALELFDQMINKGMVPDILSVNTVLRTMKRSRSFKYTLDVMGEFFLKTTNEYKITPNVITYVQLLQKANRTKNLEQCFAYFHEMVQVCVPDNMSMIILIQAYLKQEDPDMWRLDDILDVFNQWIDSFDDPKVYIAMLNLLAKDETIIRYSQAHAILRQMEERNILSEEACTIVMELFNRAQQYQNTIAIYDTIQKRGMFPSMNAQIELLKALEAKQEWVRVCQLFVQMTKKQPNPIEVIAMAYLATSTHLNNWVFDEAQLERIAMLKMNKCHKQLALWEANPAMARKPRSFACLMPCSTNAVLDLTDWNDTLDEVEVPPNELNLLTQEEEKLVLNFYQVQVQDSCTRLFRTSDKVKSAAVVLFKRFYLSNSVMEFHPKFIAPTVIYVAGKVEEQYISVDNISEQLQVDVTHVVAHEMVVLEGVRFQLIMYHPFRALTGFIDDIRVFYKSRSVDLNIPMLQSLHATTTTCINDLILTNAPLLYPPACLALAGLDITIESNPTEFSTLNLMDYLIKGKRGQQNPSDVSQLSTILNHIKQLKKDREALAEDQSQVKSVYKKLKQFYKE